MKFEITKEKLLPALIALNGIVEKKQSLPILSNILVQAAEGVIKLIATDMEVERTISIVNEVQEEGGTAISARKILDICRALPDGASLDIRQNGTKVAVKSGRSRFTLAVMSAEEFPTAGTFVSELDVVLGPVGLRGLLSKTQFAMAHQDVRYYLNGLLIEFENNLIRAVATDGHRLAVSEYPVSGMNCLKKQIIIPRKGVIEIMKMLAGCAQDIHMFVGSNHVRVVSVTEELVTKLIDGRFPDYEKVIPKRSTGVVRVNRLLLREGLSRASILSNEKFKGVRLGLEQGKIKATAQNAEQEEAEENIDVEYSGDPIEIGFNVSYLIDALGALEDEDVDVEVTDANSSCLIKSRGKEDSRYVVMPMRL